MAKITEDYVSFEIAKLLKEKGFPQDPHICNTAYTFRGNLSNNAKSFVHNSETYAKCGVKPLLYSMAPTLQMAMKWLRETHGIDIIIEVSDPSVKDRKYYCMIWDGNNNSHILDLFNSYEEACEEAIKYCLENLVK